MKFIFLALLASASAVKLEHNVSVFDYADLEINYTSGESLVQTGDNFAGYKPYDN